MSVGCVISLIVFDLEVADPCLIIFAVIERLGGSAVGGHLCVIDYMKWSSSALANLFGCKISSTSSLGEVDDLGYNFTVRR